MGYDHFTINNVRYHGSDLTIVWQRPGRHHLLPGGAGRLLGLRRRAAGVHGQRPGPRRRGTRPPARSACSTAAPPRCSFNARSYAEDGDPGQPGRQRPGGGRVPEGRRRRERDRRRAEPALRARPPRRRSPRPARPPQATSTGERGGRLHHQRAAGDLGLLRRAPTRSGVTPALRTRRTGCRSISVRRPSSTP